ncbi:MAG: TonB-dependent receptor plug domain-containing protein [Saprospiraceae bacterium]|nr:TonB-dependent receptor plug domain-containing protein [Saprospiraceae bacterium]
MQEVPDANAAETLGRLSGVSLVRSGGEGSKVSIRGMAPSFNKVQVEGMRMASTGEGDRSTDLSMISPYMLEGIELTKAAMAENEADAIGGSVSFILKKHRKNRPSICLCNQVMHLISNDSIIKKWY